MRASADAQNNAWTRPLASVCSDGSQCHGEASARLQAVAAAKEAVDLRESLSVHFFLSVRYRGWSGCREL